MTKLKVVGLVVMGGVLLGGCALGSGSDENMSDSKAGGNQTSLTGTISKSGEQFFIKESGKQPASIDSYSVTLDNYVGKTVTITGMYSGDTLFVDKVE